MAQYLSNRDKEANVLSRISNPYRELIHNVLMADKTNFLDGVLIKQNF